MPNPLTQAGKYPPPPPAQAWQPAGPQWPPAPGPSFYASHDRPADAQRPPAEAPRSSGEQSAMEEIRDSLREFREAVQGLADQRRRYS